MPQASVVLTSWLLPRFQDTFSEFVAGTCHILRTHPKAQGNTVPVNTYMAQAPMCAQPIGKAATEDRCSYPARMSGQQRSQNVTNQPPSPLPVAPVTGPHMLIDKIKCPSDVRQLTSHLSAHLIRKDSALVTMRYSRWVPGNLYCIRPDLKHPNI